MLNARLVVVSCPRRKPLQEIWHHCQKTHWPDCPLPIQVLSPDPDIGWNANLLQCLESVIEDFILLMLDDNFLEASPFYTDNINEVLRLMRAHPDIALVKLQAGGAHPPEIHFAPWPRIREYDRRPHPFKRTNLIPSIYRRSWLARLSSAVLERCGAAGDVGRNGAIEFEITGTKLTMDAKAWPERMLGIHRPDADGGGGQSLLTCTANDAVLEGRMRPIPVLRQLCVGIPGIETFL